MTLYQAACRSACALSRFSLAFIATAAASTAQVIDFETLPDGTPTLDTQTISTEFEVAPFGVRFEVIDRNTGQFLSFPKIAKVGSPRTAFEGCGGGDDNAVPNAGVCDSFLTDDDMVGSIGSLKVTYVQAVAGAAGSLLDVDAPIGTEEWTITALDGAGNVVDIAVVTPSMGTPCGGPIGNGTARTWSLQDPQGNATIEVLLFEYTGSHPTAFVGVAFDNFTPAESGLGQSVAICDPVPNSTMGPALTFASGSPRISDNSVRLTTQGLPANSLGYYLTSQTVGITTMPAGSQGTLCLSGSIGRFSRPGEVQHAGSCGLFDLNVDLGTFPSPSGTVSVMAGETRAFQCWYRDQNPTSTSNFSSAVQITFQ